MKKIFLYIVIGIILLAIPATIFLLSRQKDIRTRAAPATTLSLTPATQTVNVGDDKIKLTVQMDPGQNQVITAALYITYDPTKLDISSITNGTNAPKILDPYSKENGTASIRVSAADDTHPITTSGPIAIITLKAVGSTSTLTPTEVKFATNTFIGGINDSSANVLVGTTKATITINDTNPAPTLAATTPTATPTASLLPSLTPTPPASQSAEATPSALTITAPASNENVVSTQPVFEGKAPPGSTVTIVIHSTEMTFTVTADENGNWTYTPTTPLDAGPHNVVASVLTASGETQTSSTSFVVVASGSDQTTPSTDSAMPISGSVETTLVMIAIGIILIASGTFLWHF